ncbi:hypothetical protein [Sporolactobacillus inulinus]|jgi:hypothetical protein|uniref:Paramyx_RNA_pol, paramyxovirus RNA dependent RNA polymerase n=2 Tax=Sporolactobacillus inulinus TaxID=2078 RepID=A0A4Y1ZE02_9BACL|nr:hypothetical protein [Sporolactobacillus inulinus]KLI03551.1 hypothetical protein SINU_02170 [Sporolactobacillus inulinus CASD]GAY77174.1 paramyx_RNA_pol, paramyxovirus RNA dependent RNA polymerase [Sporolactobacillus inulinus]GEB76983.1 hypothetical protein SIN01_13280 [Sporolactobacillus inulinus]
MKRLWFSFAMSLSTLCAFGMAMIPLVELTRGLALLINENRSAYSVTLHLAWFVPILLLGIVEAIDHLWNRRKKRLPFWIYPLITPAKDERERSITASASHASFIALWVGAPICAGLLCFYPLVIHVLPVYPILVALLLPLVQVIVYYLTIRKIYL